ncbi:sensor histidine kinase [Allonocardiopsis opalescens]|uniref:Signal transduction histidine kinase n=1 Tax=Allonocardiopsis opalescens TaxID=1144618 RepID=A0A2T0PVD4_9ACTN|nr:sensor histidine kinase [Allonocardiopsis opalescens]PRX95467.1 signal transduction histidine kinase [Allonocardiopsis opalescens]
MTRPPPPRPSPAAAATGLGELEQALSRIAVLLRAGSTAAGAVIALAGLAPPAETAPTLAALGLLAVWTCVFAARVRVGGLTPALCWLDLGVVSAVVLAESRVTSAAANGTGGSWVIMVATASVFILQGRFPDTLSPWAWLLPLAGGPVLGIAWYAGSGGHAAMPVVLVVQAVLCRLVAYTLYRAATSLDRSLDRRTRVQAEAAVRAAVRAAERDRRRELHDTVLATLTMVATGAVRSSSAQLRERARLDLAVLDAVAAGGGAAPPEGPARLDLALRGAVRARGADAGLRVALDAPPVELPGRVVAAIVGGVTEALTNAVRHSGAPSVDVRVAEPPGAGPRHGVLVTVSDAGRGFRPEAVAGHRRGVRESILGRMSDVGGHARVLAEPGVGTRVELRWPAPDSEAEDRGGAAAAEPAP